MKPIEIQEILEEVEQQLEGGFSYKKNLMKKLEDVIEHFYYVGRARGHFELRCQEVTE